MGVWWMMDCGTVTGPGVGTLRGSVQEPSEYGFRGSRPSLFFKFTPIGPYKEHYRRQDSPAGQEDSGGGGGGEKSNRRRGFWKRLLSNSGGKEEKDGRALESLLAEPRTLTPEEKAAALLEDSTSAGVGRRGGGRGGDERKHSPSSSSSSVPGRKLTREERLARVKEQAAQSDSRATRDALRRAKLRAQMNLEKTQEIQDKSERMAQNAENFASLARKLREQEQKSSSWFGF